MMNSIGNAVISYFKHLPRKTEENHKNMSQNSKLPFKVKLETT
jgi:hypothetical protein